MKKLFSIVMVAVMVLSLVACGANESTQVSEAPQEKEEATVEETKAPAEIGGVDTVEEVDDTKTYKEHIDTSVWSGVAALDPAIAQSGSCTPMYNMYLNQLMVLNEETGEFEPELAEAYEIVDATTSKYTLKQGIKFSNGEELTAEDVKYSLFERPGTVEGATATYWKKIEDVEIIDDYNFIIHLNQPDPEIFYYLAGVECSILNKKACEAGEGGNLIGTGGFKVTNFVASDRTEFEKFDESFVWVEEGDTPTKTVTIKSMDQASSIAAVQAGEVANSLCEREDVESYLASDPNVETITFGTWGNWVLAFNQHEGSIFRDDKNLQKAIVAAFDRDMMAEFYAGDLASVQDSFFPKYMFGYTNEYEFAKYDLEKAKEYLSQSKYPDGNVTVRLITSNAANYTTQVTVLQSILESNLGIKVDITQLDKAGRTEAIADGTGYDLFMMDYTAARNGAKLQNRFEVGGANNWANVDNEEIRQLYIDYLSTSNEDEQLAALHRIQEIEAEELYYVPYAYMVTNAVAAKGVSGINWKTSCAFDFHRIMWEEQ